MPDLIIPKDSHAAREYMLALGRELPEFWRACDAVKKTSTTPPCCYLSDEECGQALVEAMFAKSGNEGLRAMRNMDDLQVSRLIMPCTTLACWRMTQGIYRIDPAIYAALIETPLSGDIPTSVLMHLPEWCLYIETPGLLVARRDGGSDVDLRGVFVRINFDHRKSPSLCVCLDIPVSQAGLEVMSISLESKKPLPDTVRDAMAEWGAVNEQGVAAVTNYMTPVINCLLYICHTADVSGKHGSPGNPAPVRTRRDGLRLFPADGTRTWDVGVRMGAALRTAYQSEQSGTAGSEHIGPRPHVRRAHWHGFRSGPKKYPDGSDIPTHNRKFELRWLPPIPVNLSDVSNMPSVIRAVI